MPTNFDVAPPLFRQLMGRFATGVTVITATDAGAPRGMTASSVASVSLAPPLLSVCVEMEAALHDLFIQSPNFAVNVLAEDQEELSRRFAGPQIATFEGVGYHTSERGLVLLDGSVAHIECRRVATHAAGDHTILLGGVIGGGAHEARPLLHFRGGYASLG